MLQDIFVTYVNYFRKIYICMYMYMSVSYQESNNSNSAALPRILWSWTLHLSPEHLFFSVVRNSSVLIGIEYQCLHSVDVGEEICIVAAGCPLLTVVGAKDVRLFPLKFLTLASVTCRSARGVDFFVTHARARTHTHTHTHAYQWHIFFWIWNNFLLC